jgi:two-component system phosphate regulon sensor histidine kinase PhoR
MMTVALLGLIGFQWYWVDSVIRSNEERFKRDVLEALHSVSEKLEKQEALFTFHQRMSYSQSTPQGFRFQGQPNVPNPTSANSSIHRPQKTQSTDPNVDMEVFGDTMVLGEEFGFNIFFDFQTGTITRSELQLQDLNTLQKQQLEEVRRENELVRKQMEEQMERVTRKSEMVFQVLENVLVPERGLLSRFNPNQLDSLLKFELQDRGIDIGFDYAVVSPGQNRFVLLNDQQAKEELEKSELKANLFPNDLLADPNWLVVNFPDKQQYLLRKIWLTMASSGFLVLIIVASFGYSIHTIIRQKKLSEMKNDFINNMTHELKTPIATISLASEALSDNEISESPGLKERYLKVISDENKRLGEQVERVLNMAALDKNDIELKNEVLQMDELVHAAIEKSTLQVEKRGGKIKYIDNAEQKAVYGDKTHLVNILVNLLDNANKYSPEAPAISIRLYNKTERLLIDVQDHGIGMTREAINHIFQRFYRVPTGNIHDVKGFGLGLAYVKTMTELHQGTVSVSSEPGKGSKFTITLPLTHGKA